MAEIPGLRAPIPVLKWIRQIMKDIHIHKEQCIHLRDRTSILRTTLQDIFYREPDNAKILRAADAIDDILRRLHDHMLEWIELGRIGCFLKQSDISRELSMLERDLEITGLRFSITKVMECVRARNSFRMAQVKDKAQLSETIRSIMTSRKDMDVIIKLRHLKPEAVKSIMESAQNALYADSGNSVKSRQDRFALENGLRELWQCTGILPPLLNFTKGVKKIGVSPVGKRNFYDIWKGEWLGANVVLKCLGKVGWLDQATEKEFHNEISTWRRLYHPRVEELYGICFLGPYLYIVSPWTENWNAIRYLHANPQADRAKLVAEAATGLAYLHRQTPPIIHGDFRAACILIAESGKAQITDYGMPRLEEILDAQASRPLSSTGAVRWMAPELVNPGLIGHETPQPTTATDTWSFGMVSYEVFSLARPYAHCSLDEEVIKEIERGFRHKRTLAMAITGRLTNAVWGLTNDCWSRNPLHRPTMLRVASSINTPDRRQETRRVALDSANSVIATTSYTRAQSTTLNSRMRNHSFFRSPRPLTLEVPSRLLGRNVENNEISRTEPSVVISHSIRRDSGSSTTAVKSFPIESAGYSDHRKRQAFPTPTLNLLNQLNHDVELYSNGASIPAHTLEDFVHKMVIIPSLGSRRVFTPYRDAFLTMNTAFTDVHRVLDVLINHYTVAWLSTRGGGYLEGQQIELQFNVLDMIEEWIKKNPIEEADFLTLDRMKSLISKFRDPPEVVTRARRLISEIIDPRLHDISDLCGFKTHTRSSMPVISGTHGQASRLSQVTPELVAQHLTMIESRLYMAIRPGDIMAWLWRRRLDAKPVINYLVNNLKVTTWVQKLILRVNGLEEARERADKFVFFILVAHYCCTVHNYSTMSAIVLALYSTVISRLCRTREHVEEQYLEQLNAMANLMDNLRVDNYPHAASSKSPVVPWLYIHLKDMSSIFERHPNNNQGIKRMLFNSRQCENILGEIRTTLRFQSQAHKISCVPKVMKLLQRQLSNIVLGPELDSWMERTSQHRLRQEELTYGLSKNKVLRTTGIA